MTTARHPMPANTPDLELSSYPPAEPFSSSSAPLLAGPGASSSRGPQQPPFGLYPYEPETSSPGAGSRRRRATTHKPTLKRYWKPVLLISLPFALLFLYSVIHPHVPGLPPLPKVKVHFDSDSDALGAGSGEVCDIGLPGLEGSCDCGHTTEGARLCSVYRPEGLRASRLVEGTGARVRRVLQKARDGEKIKVGILGGSVSACHGLHPSPDFPQGDPAGPGCYTTLINDWFTNTFKATTHEFLNGAIGGMDSSYYAFCGTHHIAIDTDIIILEFDVNDQTDIIYQAFFDQLLRVLSEFKSQPAVVILGSWSPQVAQDVGYADPQLVHLPIATFYDIPYVSMKRLMFNHYLRYPHSTAKSFFQPDMLHPNARGHRILADLLIAYLETELCLLSKFGLPPNPPLSDTLSSHSAFSTHVEVPFPLDPLHLIDPYTAPPGWEKTFEPEPLAALTTESRHFVLSQTPYSISPVPIFTPLRDVVDPKSPDPASGDTVLSWVQPKMFCADANDRETPLTPTTNDGWKPFVWNGEKHFWVADRAGAKISVDIQVNAGRVAVYYYRSQHYDLGDALCWVDDNEKGAVSLSGYWTKQYNVAVVAYIDEKVTPGDHYVTCQVASNTSHPTNPDAHNFRIVAVMAT